LQQGVTSLVGIYMVGSGCAILGKLKPMVRFHLPFTTLEETKYRVLSMYLLAQYLIARRGRRPDWRLEHLVQLYEDLHAVNEHLLHRLTRLDPSDPGSNALLLLKALSYAVAFSVDQRLLDEVERLFTAYLERAG
jgi:hypothetical protein